MRKPDPDDSPAAPATTVQEGAHLRALAALGLDLVAVFDETGRRVHVSPRLLEVLGWDEEELLSLPPREIDHPDELALVRRRLAEMLGEDDPEPLVHRLRCRDGSWRWFETLARSLGGGDGARQIVTISRDVSERVRGDLERRGHEERARQAQKLESLGALAGGIAHDFNNLLVGIQGNAQLALDTLEEDSPAGVMLRDILHASARASELTQQLLTYAGKRRFTANLVDLAELLSEMRPKLLAGVSKDAVLEVSPADEPVWIQGDEAQLRQVVLSLVANASEALVGPGGRVTVSTGVSEVDAAFLASCVAPERLEPGFYGWLEIADDGCGMDDATLGRIFDPFYTTKFQGRGLGLAALLGIVRSHEGTVHIETRPGAGTRARAFFPSASTPDPARVAEARRRIGAAPVGSVLVVDDESTVRTVARRMLQRAGYTVTVADGGVEAVARIREGRERISVVVLDITMPGMDGEATYQALRRLQPDLPVIFATGHSEAEAAAVLKGKTGAGLLSKPFTMEGLHDAVGGALASADA